MAAGRADFTGPPVMGLARRSHALRASCELIDFFAGGLFKREMYGLLISDVLPRAEGSRHVTRAVRRTDWFRDMRPAARAEDKNGFTSGSGINGSKTGCSGGGDDD